MSVQRFDIGGLSPAKRRADGTLVAEAYFTRAGVFPYSDGKGGIRRELRLPDHVFDRESMDSFSNLVVTNNHPDAGLIDSRSAKKYAVGATGDSVHRDGERMRGKVMIYDADTIDAVEGGKVQLSNGYKCDLIHQAGVHPVYGAYDAVQTNIRGNHVAIVDAGRAGPDCRLRVDGAIPDGVMLSERSDEAPPKAASAPLLTGDRKSPSMRGMDPEEALRALGTKVAQLETSNTKLDDDLKSATNRAAAAEAERDLLKAKVDKLEAQRLDESQAMIDATVKRVTAERDELKKKLDGTAENFDVAVADRATLLSQAYAVLGPDRKDLAALTDRKIRVEMIKHLDSTVDVSDKREDAALEAVSEMLYADFVSGAEARARVAETLAGLGTRRQRADAAPAQAAGPVNPYTGQPILPRRYAASQPLPSHKLRNAGH